MESSKPIIKCLHLQNENTTLKIEAVYSHASFTTSSPASRVQYFGFFAGKIIRMHNFKNVGQFTIWLTAT